jgi:hypothetical protein
VYTGYKFLGQEIELTKIPAINFLKYDEREYFMFDIQKSE